MVMTSHSHSYKMENLPHVDQDEIELVTLRQRHKHIDNVEEPPPPTNPAAGKRENEIFYKYSCFVGFFLLFICVVLCLYLFYEQSEQSQQTLERDLKRCHNSFYQLEEEIQSHKKSSSSCEKQLKKCDQSSSLCEQDLERFRKSSSKFEDDVQSHKKSSSSCEKQLKECDKSSSLCKQDLERFRKSSSTYQSALSQCRRLQQDDAETCGVLKVELAVCETQKSHFLNSLVFIMVAIVILCCCIKSLRVHPPNTIGK